MTDQTEQLPERSDPSAQNPPVWDPSNLPIPRCEAGDGEGPDAVGCAFSADHGPLFPEGDIERMDHGDPRSGRWWNVDVPDAPPMPQSGFGQGHALGEALRSAFGGVFVTPPVRRATYEELLDQKAMTFLGAFGGFELTVIEHANETEVADIVYLVAYTRLTALEPDRRHRILREWAAFELRTGIVVQVLFGGGAIITRSPNVSIALSTEAGDPDDETGCHCCR